MAKRNKARPADRLSPDAPPPRPAGALPSEIRNRARIGAALIVLLIAFAYVPCVRGGFILDDHLLLTENAIIKAPDGLYKFWFTTEAVDYWPVTNSSLWLEWRLWGTNPIGYHVTNIALHIAASLLLWALLHRLSIPGAFLAALVFAVHPVNVESVAWIAQRKNLLALLFVLVSILCFLRVDAASTAQSRLAAPASEGWYWMSLAAFVLAMLSKGSVAILPLLLLGILGWLRPLAWRDLIRTAPFFLVSALLVLVNVWFQARATAVEGHTIGLVERLLGAGTVVWFYLYKALLPIHLSFVYPQWNIRADAAQWWVPLLATVAVTAVLVWYRRSWGRPLLLAWGVFCVSLAPVMGFTDVGFMQHSLVADHYQHLALIGVVALIAAGWGRWQQGARASRHWVPIAAAAAVIGMLAVLTWRQSALYADGVTLFRATLAENPTSAFVHNNLGLALLEAGRADEAGQHFERALQLRPDFPEVHYNLAGTLLRAGHVEDAIGHFQQAVQLRPLYPEYHHDLGVALLQVGQLDPAIAEFERALQLNPDYVAAHYGLGNALAQLGRRQEAIEQFQQAVRLRPAYPEAHNNLGAVLLESGRSQAAMAEYEEALRLKPDFAEARSNLGRALLQAGRAREAIEHLQQLVRLQPNSPAAHNDLGVALTNAGQIEAGIEQFQQVLQLRPDDPEARSNLSEARAMKEKAAVPVE